jgi:hypothetical protein
MSYFIAIHEPKDVWAIQLARALRSTTWAQSSAAASAAKGFAVVALDHHTPACADAFPFLDEQNAAEKIGLYVEPIKAAHVARRINAAKMHGGHGRIPPATLLIFARKLHGLVSCSM